MENEEIDKKILKWFFGIFLIGSVFWIVMSILTDEPTSLIASEKYLKNFNISFSGVITEKQDIFSNVGLFSLEITYSSVAHYDPRDSLDFYYCVINWDKAEIIESPYDDIHIGDSLVVNGVTDSVKIFRESKLLHNKRLHVSNFEPLIAKAKKLHRL